MGLKNRGKGERKRLVNKAYTFIVLLTKRYLRTLDEDTIVKIEFEKVRYSSWHPNVFLALEPKLHRQKVSRIVTKKFSLCNPPHILDFSTIKARKKNFPLLKKFIRYRL